MCRLCCYLGPSLTIADLVTRPERSIIRQSFDARERLGGSGSQVYDVGRLNADGFGLGWYVDRALDLSPCVFTDVGPAWNNKNLRNLANKISSDIIFAHVRAAGPSMGVCSCSCHPFEYGRFLFMHNGQVTGFRKIRRQLLAQLNANAFNFAIENSCSDSAVAFAVFINQLGNEPDAGLKRLPPAKLQEKLQETIDVLCQACEKENVPGVSLMNFVVSDGESVAATRFVHSTDTATLKVATAASLYFASGSSFEPVHPQFCTSPNCDGETGGCEASVSEYRMIRRDVRDNVVIVTSEPLTEMRSDWIPIPTNHILLIAPNKEVLMSPILRKNDVLDSLRGTNATLFYKVLDRFELNTHGRKLVNKKHSISYTECDGAVMIPSSGGGHQGISPSSPNTPYSAFSNTSSINPVDTFLPLTTSPEESTNFQHNNDASFPEHTMTGKHSTSILSVVAYKTLLFSADSGGSGNLCIWDLNVWKCVGSYPIPTGGVLSMAIDERKNLLYTSCSNNLFIWSITSKSDANDGTSTSRIILQRIGEVRLPAVGHVLSVIVDSRRNRIFLGCQDSCIRCIEFVDNFKTCDAEQHIPIFYLKEADTEQRCASSKILLYVATLEKQSLQNIANCKDSTTNHLGYVYSLLLYKDRYIVSAGGDGIIKLWDPETLSIRETLIGHRGSIHALCECPNSETLLSGSRDETIRAWDMDTLACRRVVTCSSTVLTMQIVAGKNKSYLVSGHSDHSLSIWSLPGVQLAHSFRCPQGLVFSIASPSSSISSSLKQLILCGTSCGSVVSWSIRKPHLKFSQRRSSSRSFAFPISEEVRFAEINQSLAEYMDGLADEGGIDEILMETLRELVRIRTVSNDPRMHEECWFGAKVIARILEAVGGEEVRMIFDEDEDRHESIPVLPIVSGTIKANHSDKHTKTVVVYGHYDVVDAVAKYWDSDPWEMNGRDGYLYGRGVTDDKGPILASIYAAKMLQLKGELKCHVSFIIEGQEESGLGLKQRGFQNVVRPAMFPNICGILISNNYWIDDKRPCLTYGMRGVIDLEVSVKGPQKDLHAGVHGGCLHEVTNDLIAVLDGLTNSQGEVVIPAVLEGVRTLSKQEQDNFERIQLDVARYAKEVGVKDVKCADPIKILQARWSKPSISISNVTTSNLANHFRRIPCSATARVSLHFVPDQNAEQVERSLISHIEESFAKRNSTNQISISVRQVSDWWLGDTNSEVYKVAQQAIESVWQMKPLYVREGGSYGGISAFLEQTLGAPVIHLPMGQATDSAHLPNERISVENLVQGRLVVQEFLRGFSSSQ